MGAAACGGAAEGVAAVGAGEEREHTTHIGKGRRGVRWETSSLATRLCYAADRSLIVPADGCNGVRARASQPRMCRSRCRLEGRGGSGVAAAAASDAEPAHTASEVLYPLCAALLLPPLRPKAGKVPGRLQLLLLLLLLPTCACRLASRARASIASSNVCDVMRSVVAPADWSRQMECAQWREAVDTRGRHCSVGCVKEENARMKMD